MVDQTARQDTSTFQPDYMERFLKDLLSNIYRVNPETGKAEGIAATSPLYGKAVVDAQGNPVYERDAQGNVRLDIRGNPIQKVEGGIPQAEVMPFTDMQRRALELGVQGIGAYGPMMEAAQNSYAQGIAALSGTMGAYDPNSYKAFYDPFVEEVIGTTLNDIRREGDIERGRVGGNAVQAGAFGGSRQAVAEQELFRNTADQMARTGAQLRSAAYTGAQQQAQQVFENQMNRGQSAAQIFSGLGTAQGALGEAAQNAVMRDVNSLFNLGALEQTQQQGEYDVQRANAIESMYEPYQRFSYMSDILRGVPSSSSTISVTSAPTPSRLSSTLGTAMSLGAYGSKYGGGQGIIGALTNPSGAF